jgi:uncharacterized Zn-finger protein
MGGVTSTPVSVMNRGNADQPNNNFVTRGKENNKKVASTQRQKRKTDGVDDGDESSMSSSLSSFVPVTSNKNSSSSVMSKLGLSRLYYIDGSVYHGFTKNGIPVRNS